MKKRILGFSLIELMFMLVAVSCILAAISPVMIKKISASSMSISANLKGAKTDCSESFGEDCTLCNKNNCLVCNLVSCSSGQQVDYDSCSCVSE